MVMLMRMRSEFLVARLGSYEDARRWAQIFIERYKLPLQLVERSCHNPLSIAKVIKEGSPVHVCLSYKEPYATIHKGEYEIRVLRNDALLAGLLLTAIDGTVDGVVTFEWWRDKPVFYIKIINGEAVAVAFQYQAGERFDRFFYVSCYGRIVYEPNKMRRFLKEVWREVIYRAL